MGQPNTITTHSVEDGLDFACSLCSDAISQAGAWNPRLSQTLLSELASYVQFRYVGEVGLAFEYLVGLGLQCDPAVFRSELFWQQLRWVADAMRIPEAELTKLEFPNA
jgi:hypothetical protein